MLKQCTRSTIEKKCLQKTITTYPFYEENEKFYCVDLWQCSSLLSNPENKSSWLCSALLEGSKNVATFKVTHSKPYIFHIFLLCNKPTFKRKRLPRAKSTRGT